MLKHVRTTIDGPVLEVVLDRPPANAIDSATSHELFKAFENLNNSEDLRVGILSTSANDKNIFSAGWDLKVIAAGGDRSDEEGFDLGPGGIGGRTVQYDL